MARRISSSGSVTVSLRKSITWEEYEPPSQLIRIYQSGLELNKSVYFDNMLFHFPHVAYLSFHLPQP